MTEILDWVWITHYSMQQRFSTSWTFQDSRTTYKCCLLVANHHWKLCHWHTTAYYINVKIVFPRGPPGRWLWTTGGLRTTDWEPLQMSTWPCSKYLFGSLYEYLSLQHLPAACTLTDCLDHLVIRVVTALLAQNCAFAVTGPFTWNGLLPQLWAKLISAISLTASCSLKAIFSLDIPCWKCLWTVYTARNVL